MNLWMNEKDDSDAMLWTLIDMQIKCTERRANNVARIDCVPVQNTPIQPTVICPYHVDWIK